MSLRSIGPSFIKIIKTFVNFLLYLIICINMQIFQVLRNNLYGCRLVILDSVEKTTLVCIAACPKKLKQCGLLKFSAYYFIWTKILLAFRICPKFSPKDTLVHFYCDQKSTYNKELQLLSLLNPLKSEVSVFLKVCII